MKNMLKKYLFTCCIFSVALLLISACEIKEPVDEDYYYDIDKIKGKNKPEPPPVIDIMTVVLPTMKPLRRISESGSFPILIPFI